MQPQRAVGQTSPLINPTEELLVRQHMGLVKYIVRSMNPPNPTEEEDYISVGLMGLLESIRKYNPKKGKLTTYCYRIVVGRILNYIRDNKQHKETASISNLQLLTSKAPSHWEDWLPDSLTKEERNILQQRFEYGYTAKDLDKKIYQSAIKKVRECHDS